MKKLILSTITAMLMGGSAIAGDIIAPPVSKYVEVPLPPKRPTNFGKIDNQKVAQKLQEVITRK
jgi:hypothetical protein